MFGKKKKDGLIEPLGVYSVKHLSGLEIPQAPCNIAVYGNRISISTGAIEFDLNMEKILAIDFDMDVDIERYQKSSKLKGIAGAVAFGVTGAVIGSVPTNKIKRNVTTGAVISYMNFDGDIAYMVFEDIAPNSMQAARLVDKLRPMIKTTQTKKKVSL